ncbi:glycosyltransferase family 2 protein [Georgenia alba]|uniref:Glycosyltransferase family 2 protein n=1 Tax=Georgenia alba TaxID=2233858 RepID=A0ABW2Q7N9_9MICO
MAPHHSDLTVDVVICCYTLDRWELLVAAVRSVRAQTRRPGRLVISVDHNRALFERCAAEWGAEPVATDGPVPVVVENRYPGRLGSARNTGIEHCTADVVAFLDDDAAAEPDWLETLLAVYADRRIYAVGGAPRPRYEAPRPAWLPESFNWVFGCHYEGLPETLAPVRHLIGANMSVRRAPFVALGGFHADDHDDQDLSHNIAHTYGPDAVIYEPKARVNHFVSANRLTWQYFSRRCFVVNRSKVASVADMGEAGNIGAELRFALGVARSLPRALRAAARRDVRPLQHFAVAVTGLGLAGAGHLVGKVELALGRRRPQLSTGLERPSAAAPDEVTARPAPARGVEEPAWRT